MLGTEVYHRIYGYGVVIAEYVGSAPGGRWLVQYYNVNEDLHDGNGYCKGAPNRCWYYYEKDILRMTCNRNSIAYYLRRKQ